MAVDNRSTAKAATKRDGRVGNGRRGSEAHGLDGKFAKARKKNPSKKASKKSAGKKRAPAKKAVKKAKAAYINKPPRINYANPSSSLSSGTTTGDILNSAPFGFIFDVGLDENLWRYLYERDEIARTAAQAPVADALHPPPTFIEPQEGQEIEGLDEVLRSFEIWKKFETLFIQMRVFGYSLLYVQYDDTADLSQPPAANSKVLKFVPISPESITESTGIVFEERTSQPNFGDPILYRVNSNVNGTSRIIEYHADRMIHVTNDGDITGSVLGMSMFAPASDLLLVKKNMDLYKGLAFARQVNGILVLHVPASMGDPEFDDLKQNFYLGDQNEFLFKRSTSGNEGDEFKIEFIRADSGLKPDEWYDAVYKALGAVFGIPQARLLGANAGTLAASDVNIRIYMQTVDKFQEGQIEPVLRTIIQLLVDRNGLPAPPENYKVDWGVIWQLNDLEIAELHQRESVIDLNRSTTIARYEQWVVPWRKETDGRIVPDEDAGGDGSSALSSAPPPETEPTGTPAQANIADQELPLLTPTKPELNYRVMQFDTMTCGNCRYFTPTDGSHEGDCAVLVDSVLADFVCDAWNSTDEQADEFDIPPEDVGAFIRGMVIEQPFKHNVRGGLNTPAGILMFIEDSVEPEPHLFSLSLDFAKTHLVREHGWDQELIDRLIRVGRAAEEENASHLPECPRDHPPGTPCPPPRDRHDPECPYSHEPGEPCPLTPLNLQAARDSSKDNRTSIEASAMVSCYTCAVNLLAGDVKEWDGDTAICPNCQCLSLLGDDTGFPIDDLRFLDHVRDHYPRPKANQEGSEEWEFWRLDRTNLDEQDVWHDEWMDETGGVEEEVLASLPAIVAGTLAVAAFTVSADRYVSTARASMEAMMTSTSDTVLQQFATIAPDFQTVALDPTADAIVQFLDTNSLRISGTYADWQVTEVTNQLQQGLLNDEGIDALTQRFKDRGTFSDLSDNRIRRIVRTEAATIENEAADVVHRESGVNRQIYLAAPDADEGQDNQPCVALDRTEWDINDPSKPRPPIHPFGRCIMAPIIPTGDT